MIAYILIFFAAIFNAAMDRLENDVAFNRSIFNHLDAKFWLKSVSWQYADKVFGWKCDGWHICKSAMIVLLIAAILFGNGLAWWHFPILGTLWNVTFNLFYNRIMKR
jgi:hypothetical protein